MRPGPQGLPKSELLPAELLAIYVWACQNCTEVLTYSRRSTSFSTHVYTQPKSGFGFLEKKRCVRKPAKHHRLNPG